MSSIEPPTKGFATAIAHPNIALIKYWGNRNQALHIPANGSISMNLGQLFSRTTVRIDTCSNTDHLEINGASASEYATMRVSSFLDQIRSRYTIISHFSVESHVNFPTAAGIASSAAAFAALALATSCACGLILEEAQLSQLARLGSGSACRSIPTGFTEWLPGRKHESSYAISIAPPDHWDLIDCVTIVDQQAKQIASIEGHSVAHTSPLQAARLATANKRLDQCRQAIRSRDFEALAEVVELDSNMMHAVMMTSSPSLFYWKPTTLLVMNIVRDWRNQGMPVCYTIDAGPNLHVLCPKEYQAVITQHLAEIPGVIQVVPSPVGGPARLEN